VEEEGVTGSTDLQTEKNIVIMKKQSKKNQKLMKNQEDQTAPSCANTDAACRKRSEPAPWLHDWGIGVPCCEGRFFGRLLPRSAPHGRLSADGSSEAACFRCWAAHSSSHLRCDNHSG